jgi:hypothetical protein
MVIPPFNDAGDGGAEFCCLAFAPIRYRQTRKPELPAALGIYFCSHKDFTRFSSICFGADGQLLAYTRGNDRHDLLEFVMLSALLQNSIHPAVWRLFPQSKIPTGFRSEQYEAARRSLCSLLFYFRGLEAAARLTSDLPNDPLMVCDESAGRVALGDSKEEDEEIERVVSEATD